ncbi:MAG: hypothetical protein PHT94_00695 [Candidatus Nanoarchaeia archaeon]|nr:hypothetical protein [Candidatus Nanoarchaeia archaeon]
MRTITLDLYTINELSDEAKNYAIETFKKYGVDSIELDNEDIKHALTYIPSVVHIADVFFTMDKKSLSYCSFNGRIKASDAMKILSNDHARIKDKMKRYFYEGAFKDFDIIITSRSFMLYETLGNFKILLEEADIYTIENDVNEFVNAVLSLFHYYTLVVGDILKEKYKDKSSDSYLIKYLDKNGFEFYEDGSVYME